MFSSGNITKESGLLKVYVTQAIFNEEPNRWYGFSTIGESEGSIIPVQYKGADIRRLAYALESPGSQRLYYAILGLFDQDYFSSIEPEDGLVLTTATADSYSQFSGFTQWYWSGQTTPAVWDGSGLVTAVIR
jgi:hypothetical protein